MKLGTQAKMFVGLLALMCVLNAYPAQGAKVALVIGNASYPPAASGRNIFGPLTNPLADAQAMAAKLKQHDFWLVSSTGRDPLLDLNQRQMKEAVNAFMDSVRPGDVALFYFSGHGIQVKGENYLIPAGNQFADAIDVQEFAVTANWILRKMEATQARVKLMILDACRNEMALPPSSELESKGFGDENLGFAQMVAKGTLIGYAASLGEISYGSKQQLPNSLYTWHLLQAMEKLTTLPIELVFHQVQTDVASATGGRQHPWTGGNLIGDYFCLDPCQALAPGPQPTVEPTPKIVYVEVTPVPTLRPAPTATPQGRGNEWTDPVTGMEFVRIPAGCFQMGSPKSEKGRDGDEEPVHEVCLQEFWMGKYEVTNRQYRQFKRDHDSKAYEGHSLNSDKQPAVYVSWNDAKDFTEWLTNQHNAQYTFRLPTEAEWEYAARAGITASRYWGDDPDDACRYANVHDQTSDQAFDWSWEAHNCNDGYAVTAPVGSFRPNPFGLYDMLGNVWEWCLDTYHNSYEGAPSDGSVWGNLDDEKAKLLRGGSWYDSPTSVRSASRLRYEPDNRNYIVGVRLVRGR